MWETYKAAQEAEGKKVHTGGGFSGKGFKFDEQEAAAVSERKKLQKAALGLQDSDDDDDLEQDIDQHIESMFATKRIVKEVEAPVITQPMAAPVAANPNSDKLELAKRLASRINLHKNLGAETKGATQQAAEAILKGGSAQPLITAKTVAEQLAAKLNSKLNYQPKDEDETPIESNETVFRKYEEELEINDFPQQARWKVTSKVNTFILFFLNVLQMFNLFFRKPLRKFPSTRKPVSLYVARMFLQAKLHQKESVNFIWLSRAVRSLPSRRPSEK